MWPTHTRTVIFIILEIFGRDTLKDDPFRLQEPWLSKIRMRGGSCDPSKSTQIRLEIIFGASNIRFISYEGFLKNGLSQDFDTWSMLIRYYKQNSVRGVEIWPRIVFEEVQYRVFNQNGSKSANIHVIRHEIESNSVRIYSFDSGHVSYCNFCSLGTPPNTFLNQNLDPAY